MNFSFANLAGLKLGVISSGCRSTPKVSCTQALNAVPTDNPSADDLKLRSTTEASLKLNKELSVLAGESRFHANFRITPSYPALLSLEILNERLIGWVLRFSDGLDIYFDGPLAILVGAYYAAPDRRNFG